MMKRGAIFNSFHSSAVEYIESCCPEIIISLDAHPDTSVFDFTGKIMEVAKKMPKKLRDAALRPSTHWLMRRRMPDAEIILTVPETCLWADIEGLRKLFDVAEGAKKIDSKAAVKQQEIIANKLLNIELYKSPPESLKRLAGKVKGRDLVVDIDVDYMVEFLDESYTPPPSHAIDGAKATELGSMNKVVKLIHLTKPKLITLSEAKLESIQKDNSPISRLFQMLGGIGYTVEYGDLVLSDEEACGLIKAHEDFEKNKAMKINQKYLSRKDFFSKEMIEQREEEIAKAMEEHFLVKGKEDPSS